MQSISGRDGSFRRSQKVQVGQFRFTETGLAEEWSIGKKKVRNLLATLEKLVTVNASKTASVALAYKDWTDTLGDDVSNPCGSPRMAFKRYLNNYGNLFYPAEEI